MSWEDADVQARITSDLRFNEWSRRRARALTATIGALAFLSAFVVWFVLDESLLMLLVMSIPPALVTLAGYSAALIMHYGRWQSWDAMTPAQKREFLRQSAS